MIAEQPVHPRKEQLIAFGQGKLAAHESLQIEEHLEACPDCCETLLDLKDDTFTGLVRIARLSPAAAETAAAGAESSGAAPAAMGGSEHAATPLEPQAKSRPAPKLPAELKDHPRYHIVEQIGHGGMGSVYRAEHRLMNRPVAIKVINSQLVRHPHAVERFRREVQAAAKLSHPNIVAAYDAEQAGDLHFLVMEFVDGTDLATQVNECGPLSVSAACECIRQAATGLQHAHEKGMVHRDIKPHNLMLTPEGRVRILDFGLAGFACSNGDFRSLTLQSRASESTAQKPEAPTALPNDEDARPTQESQATGHLTAIGSVMGTPDYMAPEQATDAHSADIRADIYSLGCTLHFLLTDRPPFEAQNVVEKLKAHAVQSPPQLADARHDVSPQLADVVCRMMAKDPADRFQTPAEVAAALAPFANCSDPPRKTRRRTLATALAAAAILLAGIIVLLTDKGRLEIRSERDDVDFVIMQNGKAFRTIDLQTGSQVTWLPSGDYEIALKQGNSLYNLDRKGFTLARWGKEIVYVTREERLPVDQPATDHDRLQGKWMLVSAKMRAKPLTAEQLARMAIAFVGDRAEFTDPDSGRTQAGKFTLDSSRTPKHIDFIAPDGNERLPGIFEFDGERLRLAWVDGDYARPTDFEPAETPDHMTAVLKRVPGSVPAIVPPDEPVKPFVPDESQRDAVTAAEAYLSVMDEGRFGDLWNMSAMLVKQRETRDQLSQKMQRIRDAAGKVTRRTLDAVRLMDNPPGLPKGRYANVQYQSDFERLAKSWEMLSLVVERDDQWHVVGYARTLEPLLQPESNGKARPGANKTAPPPRRTGLLTNPPKLPPEGVPVGRNLIADPSLETTPTGNLPNGWFAWLDDGPDFKCEVVEGGVAGKHCLQISGTGTRGVVFATSIPLDRTKRYALKGRVKVEGEAGTWAVVKLNYFNNTGWLGVDDRAGVTTGDFDWKQLEKTDRADDFPAATLLVPTCHIEGNGTAWFDELEVIAYDRNKLPDNFEAKHGRNNRMKGN